MTTDLNKAHHVAVSKAALQMVRNALRNDAEAGKTVRAEMLEELDKATFDLPAAPAQQAEPHPAVKLADARGPNEFKDWCGAWFGGDADETYLAKAVANLPAIARPSLTVGERPKPATWPHGIDIADEIESLMPQGFGYATRAAVEQWWRDLVELKLSKIATPAAQAEPVAADAMDAARYRALRGTLGRQSFSYAPLIVAAYNMGQTYTPEGLDEVCDRMVAHLQSNPPAQPIAKEWP